jgi:anti-anti-sigma factor
MDIKKQTLGDRAEIQVIGHLDAYWAPHLGAALNDSVRQGSHEISLDLSEVDFMSSAGLGVLVACHRQLQGIRGTLIISSASDQVLKLIALSGLEDMLLPEKKPGPEGAAVTQAAHPSPNRGEKFERTEGTFDLFTLSHGSKLNASLIGDPALLRGCRFQKENCSTHAFEESAFAVGVGTLGDRFEDCEGRFGEFLAAAGAVAYLPTDGTNVPDYFVPAGSSVANVQVCYAAIFQGPFAKMARFESNKDVRSVTLSQLAKAGLELVGAERLGMVIVAETTGLVGAALRQPPTKPISDRAPFEFPEVRSWLTFTAERAYAHSLALVVGLVTRGDPGPLGLMLRPVGPEPNLAGHFHAAAFAYRPLQKGEIDLKDTVRSLFDNDSLQGVLHLLSDNRPMEGVGESEFMRGAIWMGPIS